MPEKLNIAGEVLAAAEQKKAYDEVCKKVLALKEIAARILAAVVEELKGCTIEEIISFIGTPEIGNIPVDVDAPMISLENSEDTTINEGKRFFDIKFTVKAPVSGEYLQLIINLEAQKNFSPGYSILKRGIYYCSRLISSQYGMVFTKSDYDKIRKVYSIWVCTNPSEEYKRTIARYKLSKEMLEGETKFKSLADEEKERRNYDLISLVLIGLDDPKSEELSNGIIRMLSVLFAEDMNFKAKITELENEYNIKMTEEIEEEVERMCNLSEGVWEKGVAKGVAKGENNMLTRIIANLMSKGMNFDEALNFLDIIPDNADEIKEMINKK
ncbi:MAG: hypothetical protein NC253_08360 [Ruminococcus sp.]|nr:hypothetical protein [Ruminococcus sp.]MCM1480737.1 hypothetical protein [Muribaculaceae bacterium]